MSGDNSIKFSLISGGPFHTLLGRLGLLGPDTLPTWRTVLVLVLLAWAPPAFLTVVQSLLHADYAGWDFFTDGTVYTRYLIARLPLRISASLVKTITLLEPSQQFIW